MNDFDEHSPSARWLRAGVWMCVFVDVAVFWVAAAVLVISFFA